MFITCETATRIYQTMIRPLTEYVDFVIDSCSKLLSSKHRPSRIEYVTRFDIVNRMSQELDI